MANKTGIAAAVDAEIGVGAEIEPTLPLSLPIQAGRGPGGSARIGRPRGSRNKATAAMVAYLRRNYADPLEGMAATLTRTVADLAVELECTKLEAFGLQATAMRDLAPYIYAKVPANMKLKGEGRFVLTIGDEVDLAAGEEDDTSEPFDIDGDVVEAQ